MKAKQNIAAPTGWLQRVEDLLDVVRRRIERQAQRLDLSARGRPWLVGFSHGPDSTLLLWLLARLAGLQPQPEIIAVHVDHGLRPGSAGEAEQARAFARRLGLRWRGERIPCLRGETEARTRRYELFRRVAEATGASALLLAHHRDDNLETVLFRLLRGTGPLGLSGIPELRPLGPGTYVFRPLLEIAKAEILAALRELGLPYLHDPSNEDPELTPRNRIRHVILPQLRRIDPDDERLVRLIHEARALRAQAEAELRAVSAPEFSAGQATIPSALLAPLSPWALELWWNRIFDRIGHPRPTRGQQRRLDALCRTGTRSGKKVEALGHWQAVRRRDRIEVVFDAAAAGGRENIRRRGET